MFPFKKFFSSLYESSLVTRSIQFEPDFCNFAMLKVKGKEISRKVLSI